MSLRTAVVGAGTVSENHLSGIDRNPKTELVAICDLDEDKAREKAVSYGIKAYFDVSSLLESEDLDWVHVCTPPHTHRDVAVQVLRAGIPVLIEKPVTETVEEFDDIARVARENDVTFSVVHNHKFDLVVRKLRDMIQAGELGTVRGMDLLYTGSSTPDVPNRGPWNFELLGGEFEEGLPHPIYIGLNAGGLPKGDDDVVAQTSLVGSYDMEFGYDGAQVQYVSRDDALCSIKMLSGTIPVRILYVHGEEQSVAADLVSQTLIRLDRDYKASPVARARNNIDQAVRRVRGTAQLLGVVAKDRRSGDWDTAKELNSSYYQFDEEAAALLTDRPPAVSVEEARWTVKLQEAIRESVRRPEDAIEGEAGSELTSEASSD